MGHLARRINQIAHFWKILRRVGAGEIYRVVDALGDPLPRIDVSHNQLGTFTGIRNDALFRTVKEGRWHEGHFRDLCEALIEPDWNIIDLGANIGTHTVKCSMLATKGRVFSFEPQSLTYAILQRNIIANGATNVTTYKFAVSDVSDTILSMNLFTYAGDLVNNGVVRVSDSGGLGDKTLTIKLDDLAFPRIDFMKIDIQGSEIRALNGGRNLISRDKPIVFIEIEEQHLRSLGGSSKELIELLLSLDYVLFRVRTQYPCDHICVPRERVEQFKKGFLGNYEYEVDEIDGREVRLSFANDTDQNYSQIAVIG